MGGMIILAGACAAARGAAVDAEQARLAAMSWRQSSPAITFASQAENAQPTGIKSVEPLTFSGTVPHAWHVALAPVGYIIMAADNRLAPVIAFSVTSDLDLTPSAANALRGLLIKDTAADRAALAALDAPRPQQAALAPPPEIEQNTATWERLLSRQAQLLDLPAALATNIAPLLRTAWNQTRYFNDLMPDCAGSGTGYNGKMPAGCGSIAGAQIMNYYRWPYRGTGQQGYYDDAVYRTNTLFTVYDWAALLTSYVYTASYPASNTAAIATLIRDVGYAAEMDYECTISASYNQSFSDAGNRFFYYAQTESVAFNAATAQNEILARRPLHVSYDESSGHILVADGLAMDGATAYLHINYGWGGAQDGWYRPTSLYGSASLDYMTPGLEPLCLPMCLATQNTVTNRSFPVAWTFPAWHTNALTGFDVREGNPGATTTFSDPADNFTNWWNSASGWRINGGQFFYCATNPHQGYIQLKEPVIPSASSTLTYTYRRSLAVVNNVFIEASTDFGRTWTLLAYFTGQVYDSTARAGTIALGDFNGRPLYLRLRFAHSRGIWGWYGASRETAGFYLDNLAISNCQRLNWTTVAASLDATTRVHSISNKYGGTYYHAVTAHTTNGTDCTAPFICQTLVDFDTFTIRAMALTNIVTLRWPDPVACGFDSQIVHLRANTTGYPDTTADGGELYTGTNRFYEHTGLTPGQTYYYTVFVSHDGSSFTNPP